MENSRHPAAKFRRKCLRLSRKNSFRCSLTASLRKLIFLHFPPSRCFVLLSRVSFSALASICSDRLSRWKLYCIFMCFSRICSIFKAISHCPDRAVGLLSMAHGDAEHSYRWIISRKILWNTNDLNLISQLRSRKCKQKSCRINWPARACCAKEHWTRRLSRKEKSFSRKTSWKLNNKVA